jgi:glycine betaine catabolism B
MTLGGLVNVNPLLARRPGQRFEARVVRSRPLTPTTHGIELEKPTTFTFQPTQFTFLQLDTPYGVDVRPMSLATSPTRSHLEYAVRRSDSAFKYAFAALQPGDTVVVQGPLGHYILDASRPAVLVAGGIGITPLKGMGEYAADRQLPIPVRLVYSNRSVEEIVYREELETLVRSNPNFHVLHTLTRSGPGSWKGRTGRIGAELGADLLREAAEDLDRPVYYLCGAPGFIETCYRSLVGSSVPEVDIRFEVFLGYGAAA